MKKTLEMLFLFTLLIWAGLVQAAGFERRDVTFPSQGLTCAAWYYVPTGLKAGVTRPAIVMAHGYSGVKEQGRPA
jgi:poly(3-hydroxybutyrate) depolymerase